MANGDLPAGASLAGHANNILVTMSWERWRERGGGRRGNGVGWRAGATSMIVGISKHREKLGLCAELVRNSRENVRNSTSK
jgi:hypothetical protein